LTIQKLNSKVAAARITSIPGMEQQLAETSQRNPDLKRSRNIHIRTVKSIDQQNRRMADYPTKLTDLERRIQAARRREAASMLMDKWGWPLGKRDGKVPDIMHSLLTLLFSCKVVVIFSILLAFLFNS
jgi:hypothetical protein